MIGLIKRLFFAPDGAGGGASSGGDQASQQTGQQNQQQAQAAPQIDYQKIQQMLDGTLAAKEDTALKAYFKQQGLSQEEAEQAMAAFKQQKAASQPDVSVIQEQLTQAQAAAQQAAVEKSATIVAVSLGVEAKTIPYLLRLADLSKVTGQDGTISEEAVKTALEAVLKDVPGLKPQKASGTGFFQVGADGSGQQQQQTSDEALKAAFGL